MHSTEDIVQGRNFHSAVTLKENLWYIILVKLCQIYICQPSDKYIPCVHNSHLYFDTSNMTSLQMWPVLDASSLYSYILVWCPRVGYFNLPMVCLNLKVGSGKKQSTLYPAVFLGENDKYESG